MTPSGTKPQNWIPSLTGRVDPVVEQAIRYLFEAAYSLRDGTPGTSTSPAGTSPASSAASFSVNFPGGFSVGVNSTTYHTMVFKEGILIAIQ